MNTPEHSLGDNSPGSTPANSLAASGTPAPSSAPATPPKHQHVEIMLLLMPLLVLAVLTYLLRKVPDSVLRQEFEGFGAALCAVAYAVILLWRLTRALAPDNQPPDVPDPEETSPDSVALSQNDPAPGAASPAASSLNSANPGT